MKKKTRKQYEEAKKVAKIRKKIRRISKIGKDPALLAFVRAVLATK